MNWNFGFFDADTVKRAALAAGLGAGATALFPEEAEGAQLPDFQRRFVSRFVARNKENFPVGNVEPEVFSQIQEKFPQAQNSVNAGTHAGFTRFMKSGWLPTKTAMRMGEVLDSADAAVVKNWQKNTGKGAYAEYGILIPDKNNPTFVPFYLDDNGEIIFKTLFSPSKGQMKKAGYGEEGGLLPLISSTPEATSTQRMPLSAVTSQPAYDQNIADFPVPGKLKLPAMGVISGLGAGLALTPDEAFGWGQEGLRTADFRPEDAAPLRTAEFRPSDIGGNITADLRLSGSLPSGDSAFWGEMARQFGLGSRGVLEGLGQGFTLGLGNPGKGLSDLMGLPVPQNETEQGRVGLNSALSSVPGTALLGAGLAQAPGAVLSGIGRAMRSDPVTDALLTLGDENFGKMLDYGNKVMDLLEQYEDELGDW